MNQVRTFPVVLLMLMSTPALGAMALEPVGLPQPAVAVAPDPGQLKTEACASTFCANLPGVVDDNGDTMTGNLVMRNANVVFNGAFGPKFPGGTLTGSSALAYGGVAVCLAGQDTTGCGDITSVQVWGGSGLTGGAFNGDVVLGTDFNVLQARVTGACAAGTHVDAVDRDGSVFCGTDQDTTYGAGSGLLLTGTTFTTDPAKTQNRVTGVCAAGAIRSINVDGTVACSTAGSGTVTSVGSGAGLTGGPITTSGTLSIATGGVTSAMIADGTVGAADVNGAEIQKRVTGSCAVGNALRTVNQDGTAACQSLWSRAGNAGTTPGTDFLGTSDNQALEVKVNGSRVLRLEPTTDSPNLLGGHAANGVVSGAYGAFIGGGGLAGLGNSVKGTFGVVAGGYNNTAGGTTVDGTVLTKGGTVGGGANNRATASMTTIAGGYGNVAEGTYDAVGGGLDNVAEGFGAVVAGGFYNDAHALYSTVAGGTVNTANGEQAAVLGGERNTASGYWAAVGGGQGNTANRHWAVVGGGQGNTATGLHATVPGGQDNVASNDRATVGGGMGNAASGIHATIGGGTLNKALATEATVAGGNGNEAGSFGAFVGGGYQNLAGGTWGTIGGGYANTIAASVGECSPCPDFATIGGGYFNRADNTRATVGGGDSNVANGAYATVAGGSANTASSTFSSVAGGSSNVASAYQATVGGGGSNLVNGLAATVGGGSTNTASNSYAAVGGGQNNVASASQSSVGAGAFNTASGAASEVAGGSTNTASGETATVGGGYLNVANGYGATIPGGRGNNAPGANSFAAGQRAKANHNGAFVWADSSNFDFASAANNQFNVRAVGGTRIVSGIDGSGNANAGVTLAPGGGSWTQLSDRNAKTNVQPVDPRAVLEMVAGLPLGTWSYKTQDPTIRHLGPMAQDFYAAFHLGESNTGIDTVDEEGVALAAIQGLDQEVQEQAGTIAGLRAALASEHAHNAQLEQRLAHLEAMVGQVAAP